MSDEQRIRELEKQIDVLHKALWDHVELAKASTNLIVELSRHRKLDIEETDSEHLDLLVRSRAALVTFQAVIMRNPTTLIVGFDTLLEELNQSIDKWLKRVE